MNERDLTKDEQRIVEVNYKDALNNLGLSESHSNLDHVTAVNKFVQTWQLARRPKLKRLLHSNTGITEISESLGSLWGNALYQELGWDWFVAFEDGEDRLLIGNQLRSMVIYPIDFIRICLQKPQADCTILLSFNMIREQKIPYSELTDGSYENVLGGIRHIVPY